MTVVTTMHVRATARLTHVAMIVAITVIVVETIVKAVALALVTPLRVEAGVVIARVVIPVRVNVVQHTKQEAMKYNAI